MPTAGADALTYRLREIYGNLIPCRKFADVGCDHGYIAEAMIKGGKAAEVVVSDISARSLEKAQKLLKNYPFVTAAVCDGLSEAHAGADQILIAGMGGEEIIKIISAAENICKSARLVLQPMKNADKLRRTLYAMDYAIERDYTFFDLGKFYDLIVAKKSADEKAGERAGGYSEAEFLIGRDNLRSPSEEFVAFAKKERDKYAAVLKIKEDDRARSLHDAYERVAGVANVAGVADVASLK